MKKTLLSTFLLLISFGFSQAQVSASWKLLENHFTEAPHHWAELVLKNTSGKKIDSGWKLYFNTVFLSVNAEVKNPGLGITHLQGDFFVLEGQSPALAAGEEVRIEYRSAEPYLKNSYAPEALVFLRSDGSHFEVKDYQVQEISSDGLAEMAKDTPLPIPTGELTYERNEGLSLLPEDALPPFLPSPKSWRYTGDPLRIKNAALAVSDIPEFAKESKFLLEALGKGYHPRIDAAEAPVQIQLEKVSGLPDEGYRLSIRDRKVLISASQPQGAFYGVQSFLAMMPGEFWKEASGQLILPQVEIEDAPAFGYRGFFLDVARNFQPKTQILKILDMMAFYKLNVFHFNLANDEGWRLEIPGLPELTEFGGRRGFSTDEAEFLWPYYGSGADPSKSPSGTGFYTISEFQEILRYAQARHIEVIPEFGVPAHSRAAIRAMEKRYRALMGEGREEEALQYRLAEDDDQSKYLSAQNFKGNTVCVCQESVYTFYEKLVTEVQGMFRDAGVDLKNWHTGGDEVPRGVWTASPVCNEFIAENPDIQQQDLNDYFRSRAAEILKKHGLQMGGWEEIGQSHQGETVVPNPKFADQNWRLYAWNAVAGWGGEDMAYKLANAGYPVVICSSANFYFDLAYDWDPDERGHTWSGVTDLYQSWKTVPGKLYLSHDLTIEGKDWDWTAVGSNFTRLTAEGRANILGVSGQVWTETIKGTEMLEYYIFPKMLGYIERAWAGDPAWSDADTEAGMRAARESEWNVFANAVGQKELPKLEGMFGGFAHRVPKPGVAVRDGMIFANVQTPGLIIRYTQDGSDPTASSPIYTQPIPKKGGEKFRVFTRSGAHGGLLELDREQKTIDGRELE
ncbi:family 20 glycosylhydrolase [Algoriphagus sp. H41]|uniref:beta-N-acetylhexosaminidase n=1 Tax=Algoriphagus oliviformis TaxID=2811231 RepID=A0ABS3C068_9BACT|nr:family 20 glycosylhydrolase [Algoriphagus oliviformis]MBN7810456.1 family 20 glycosylhydrolase [Algoriphagus oliviformis]